MSDVSIPRRVGETDEQFAQRLQIAQNTNPTPPIASVMEVWVKCIIPKKPCCGKLG